MTGYICLKQVTSDQYSIEKKNIYQRKLQILLLTIFFKESLIIWPAN